MVRKQKHSPLIAIYMKKLLLILLVLLIIGVSAVYILIPSQITIGEIRYINCPSTTAIRNIHKINNWSQWWPSSSNTPIAVKKNNDSLHQYNGNDYKVIAFHDLGADISIQNMSYISNGRIACMSLPSDSSALYWQSDFPATNNPFKRVTQYFEATSLKANMGNVLDSLGAYLEQDQNTYGFHIRRSTLRDSIVLVTRAVSPAYPDTKFIYGLIGNLKNYINAQSARPTSYPMLNISPGEKGEYEVMVAFATDKGVKTNNQFFTKFFQRNENKVLTVEVTGGNNKVIEGHRAIKQYMLDHHISTPVKPFEYLVTDRSLDPDTSRWVTVINYPVF